MWRMAPEPVIALDGDTAGLRAAMRLIDLALPLLSAGHSLRFALMPPGADPDDVLRSGGRAAMRRLIERRGAAGAAAVAARAPKAAISTAPSARPRSTRRCARPRSRIPDQRCGSITTARTCAR